MANTAAKPVPESIRPIRKEDNAPLADVLRAVLTEFGCTSEGFAIHDPEVDRMFETYQEPRSAYFIIEADGQVVGGGGVAPLKGGDENTCELQKFYLLPEYRGHGYGWQLVTLCLQSALARGFTRCYVETMDNMAAAGTIYTRAGFKSIDKPMGNTGHFACNRWFLKEW